MAALRLLAFLTFAVVLPGGTLLWYQQIQRLEREGTRVLTGPSLDLRPGERLRWRLDLGANTEDQAWMASQRQPRLRLPLPAGAQMAITARYLAAGPHPAAPAWVALATADSSEGAGRRVLGPADPPPALWLSYLQPLEFEFEVLAAPMAEGDARAVRPTLSGQPSADSLLARRIERTLFRVFFVLGLVGLALFVWAERRASAPT